MRGQIELFEEKPAESKPELKKGPKRLPDIRGYYIIDNVAERSITKTNKPHTCFLCDREIAVGSKAVSSAPIANNKVLVNDTRYKHRPDECLKPGAGE